MGLSSSDLLDTKVHRFQEQETWADRQRSVKVGHADRVEGAVYDVVEEFGRLFLGASHMYIRCKLPS